MTLTYIVGIPLIINWCSLIIIITIGMFSLYGLGFMLSSIFLITKEIGILFIFVKFIILFFLFNYDKNFLIPFSYAKNMIENIIINDYTLFSYNLKEVIVLILNSVVYFILGLKYFHYLEKKALTFGQTRTY